MNRDDTVIVEQDDFVLARWEATDVVNILFVASDNGRPAPGTSEVYADRLAYRWNSYHAARKYQRAHPCLEGHIILNLTDVKRQARIARECRALAKFEPR